MFYKEQKLVCVECGGKVFIFDNDHGNKFCEKCGLVIEIENIDFGRDWRFSEDNHQGAGFKYSRIDNDGTFLSRGDLFKIKKKGRNFKQKLDDEEEKENKNDE